MPGGKEEVLDYFALAMDPFVQVENEKPEDNGAEDGGKHNCYSISWVGHV